MKNVNKSYIDTIDGGNIMIDGGNIILMDNVIMYEKPIIKKMKDIEYGDIIVVEYGTLIIL